MKQPKTRNWIAVAAHQRNSAGAMGGTRKQQLRSARRKAKQALRAGKEDT